MGNARPSVTKKQREQKRRERQQMKAEKRAQRKAGVHSDAPEDEFGTNDVDVDVNVDTDALTRSQ